ncbi:heterokaryon incompatibility protein-domain-containing protein [Hypoxylon trugodes]|uniref:heterokaryon incompatibility protein-domain-containing protein n=1 Tax=Hypoxylon trugodes TaxID=326681 RepID=UPI002195B478|nr:heterokaryon incompatibility protein-domain-containing protein [Hypoxylon trugodes]KAI1390123.1 heterokaryon incompatibility protein-domain-containing protein [Hypoxylon trugodes]
MYSRNYPAPTLGSGRFRLVQISRLINGRPKLTLSEHSLDSAPKYTCVSYTWGSPEFPESAPQPLPLNDPRIVTLNGKEWEVTPNLFDFLQELSSHFIARFKYYWVDALCINQDDTNERSVQVNLMGRIYSRCEKTIIWLGRANTQTPKVSAMIRRLAMSRRGKIGMQMEVPSWKTTSRQHLVTPATLKKLGLDKRTTWDDWIALFSFYGRRWFFRTWTFQEAVLSRLRIIYWGPEMLCWDDIQQVAGVLAAMNIAEAALIDALKRGPIRMPLNILAHTAAIPLVDPHFKTERQWIPGLRVWLYTGRPISATIIINSLALRMYRTQSSDPRDKVFGLLGIWERLAKEQYAEELNFAADYSKTVQTVYIEFMATILRETESLNMLSSVPPRNGTCETEGLPSWVTDRSAGGATPIIELLALSVLADNIDANLSIMNRNLLARDDISRDFRILDRELIIPSFCFATVTHIGNSYPEFGDGDVDKTMELLLHSPQVYPFPDNRSRLKAFHSTLVLDIDQPPPDQFQIWWMACFVYGAINAWKERNVLLQEFLDEAGVPRFLESMLPDNDHGFYVPTFDELQELCEKLGYWENGDGDLNSTELFNLFLEGLCGIESSLRFTWYGRRPVLLDNGYFGMTSEDVRPGDMVRILPGARAFFTFRKVEERLQGGIDRQELVGETYVSGAMAGEASRHVERLVQMGRGWEEICVI